MSSHYIHAEDIHAEEKENYSNVLKTAAALQTKPYQYYEKIVDDLESHGHLNENMESFERSVSGLFGPMQTEDYHRLSMALYSRGYAEQSELVYRKFVEPSKKLSPQEALEKAQEKLHAYEQARDRLTGDQSSTSATTTSIADTATPLNKQTAAARTPSTPAIKQSSWEKGTVFHRLILTNGQTIEGRITEQDDKGLWLETDPGSKVYFAKSEYSQVSPIQTDNSK